MKDNLNKELNFLQQKDAMLDESAKDFVCGYRIETKINQNNILDLCFCFYLVLLRKEEEIAGNVTNKAELSNSHMVKEVSWRHRFKPLSELMHMQPDC